MLEEGPEAVARRNPPSLRRGFAVLLLGLALAHAGIERAMCAEGAPRPLLKKGGEAVDWWFAFKFNAQKTFSGCGADSGQRTCILADRCERRIGSGNNSPSQAVTGVR